jgi:hypothetical protein
MHGEWRKVRTAPGWRRALRRELTAWLALKAAALWLLWALCFSPAHQTDANAAGRALGMPAAAAGAAAHSGGPEQAR